MWSTITEMISSDTMKEDSLPKTFDLELDAIFISVFTNRATWNLIAHAHLYSQNMEPEKEKVLDCLLHWNHKHSCEQIHSYNNEYNNY